MSTIFGFSKIVETEKIGYVIEPNTQPIKFDIREKEYYSMSKKAFEVSKKYTKDLYVKNIIKGYKEKINDEDSDN